MEVGEQVKVCDVALKFVESSRVKVEGIVIHCRSSNNAREALETAAGTGGIKATVDALSIEFRRTTMRWE